MSSLNFLGIGFLLVWFGIVAFLLTLSKRQKALEQRVEELRHPTNSDRVE